MITVFAKKKFRFFPPNFSFSSDVLNRKAGSAIEFVETKINEPITMPDWVQNNDMFKWAKKDGDLFVVTGASPAPVLAASPENPLAAVDRSTAPTVEAVPVDPLPLPPEPTGEAKQETNSKKSQK